MNENTPLTPHSSTERCPEAVQRNLKAYTDGEINTFGKWRVERHLSKCESCRQEVLWLKHFAQDLREQKSITPRPELRTRILAHLPDMPSTHQPAPRRTLLLAPRYAMGTVLLLFVGLGGVFALKGAGIWHPANAEPSKVASTLNMRVAKPAINTSATPKRITLPEDTDKINQKANILFQQKMQNLAVKPTVKTPPPTIDATEATADTPNIQFVPTETAKTTDYLQQMTQTVQKMGGAVEKVPAKAPTDKLEGGSSEAVLTIRIPAKQVRQMFHSVRHLGNFSKVYSLHGVRKPLLLGTNGSVSRHQMRVPFPATGDEDRNLVLTPDNKGFVTLQMEVKPSTPERNK